MKKISGLIIAISLSGFAFADGHKQEKKDHPNKIMSGKECMETKAGVAWFLSAADNVFDEIKEYGDMKDRAWNDESGLKQFLYLAWPLIIQPSMTFGVKT
jgi:hypothetical protein